MTIAPAVSPSPMNPLGVNTEETTSGSVAELPDEELELLPLEELLDELPEDEPPDPLPDEDEPEADPDEPEPDPEPPPELPEDEDPGPFVLGEHPRRRLSNGVAIAATRLFAMAFLRNTCVDHWKHLPVWPEEAGPHSQQCPRGPALIAIGGLRGREVAVALTCVAVWRLARD
jgi:hypothetical protein